MSKAVEYGATGIQSIVRLWDLSSARPVTGVTVAGTPGLSAYWRRDFGAKNVITLFDKPIDGSWIEGGFSELYDGYYSIDTPDDAFVSPADVSDDARGIWVLVHDGGATLTCIASYHPLQPTMESPSYITPGELYCSFDDLYLEFGQDNIHKWANLDNLPTADPGYVTAVEERMTEFILQASRDVDDKLRPVQEVPITGDYFTATINRITRMKAGVWLYEARGADDYDYEGGRLTHRYTFKMDRADNMLDQVTQDKRRMYDDDAGVTKVPGVTT